MDVQPARMKMVVFPFQACFARFVRPIVATNSGVDQLAAALGRTWGIGSPTESMDNGSAASANPRVTIGLTPKHWVMNV